MNKGITGPGRWLLAGLSLLAVSACGSLPGVSQQGRAGIADWHVTFNPETGHVEEARIIDGKEKADVAFEVDLRAGTARYSARGVKAFDGQKARALLEAEISEDAKEAVPGIVDRVVGTLEKGL
ncbi:hypothetical protein [Kiloniella sp. b19]|uniref:hypothetical protein n=1 Tax=Kiloniella sp. GXU_MW_B19 TaxID=3141326 RepID=UPI0031D7CDD4